MYPSHSNRPTKYTIAVAAEGSGTDVVGSDVEMGSGKSGVGLGLGVEDTNEPLITNGSEYTAVCRARHTLSW